MTGFASRRGRRRRWRRIASDGLICGRAPSLTGTNRMEGERGAISSARRLETRSKGSSSLRKHRSALGFAPTRPLTAHEAAARHDRSSLMTVSHASPLSGSRRDRSASLLGAEPRQHSHEQTPSEHLPDREGRSAYSSSSLLFEKLTADIQTTSGGATVVRSVSKHVAARQCAATERARAWVARDGETCAAALGVSGLPQHWASLAHRRPTSTLLHGRAWRALCGVAGSMQWFGGM